MLDTSDIERVHDMRVASRRLRAVLEIYAPCFPADEFKPLLREVKALADALGARRDPDVLLEQLAKLEGSLPKANPPGVEAFAAPIHDEQARGNEILAAALDHAERTDLRGGSRSSPRAPRARGADEPRRGRVAEEPAADAVAAAEAAAAPDPVTTVASTPAGQRQRSQRNGAGA